MTENERKIAELNRLHDELHKRYEYLQELIESSRTEKFELSKKLDEINYQRQKLISHEIDKYYNLK